MPVFVKGKVAGELDIDSHFLDAFEPEDRKLCEHAAALLGQFLERHAWAGAKRVRKLSVCR